jgi:uncharacterized protein with LGFP repeats
VRGIVRKRFATWLTAFAVVALVTVPILTPVSEQSASAADASKFNPGYIISDRNFFDFGSMSANDIQNFLNEKVPSCRAGYTCLKDYTQATSTISSDAYCNGYTGNGNESAAWIIKNVANSCGISPKVLLVLLQKESLLVTDDWPMTWQYNSATGNGCPDTAACDPNLAGFFYQVFYGARSFKYYIRNNSYFNYHWGQYNEISYQANNPGCGTKSVFIENAATAALYIYTPYTPNDAALANLYGTGDACSAYGNRNFWRLYTDWFGPTGADVSGDIAAEVAAQGDLGSALTGIVRRTGSGGGFSQGFTGGTVYWTEAFGAHTVRANGFRQYYWSLNSFDGSLGWPITNEQTFSENGGGTLQPFTGGTLYKTSGGLFQVKGVMWEGLEAAGGVRGALGWPVAEQVCPPTTVTCSQSFQNGAVYWTNGYKAFASWGAINDAYVTAGALSGSWGQPTSTLLWRSAKSDGYVQQFTNGNAYRKSKGTVVFVTGETLARYIQEGGAVGRLGFPLTPDRCSFPGGRCVQDFEYGSIIWQPYVGARVGNLSIDLTYDRLGGAAGWLGSRLGSFQVTPAAGPGFLERFSGGTIVSSAANGPAFALTPAIATSYFAQGGGSGRLGWPVADAECDQTRALCQQSFTGGRVVASASGSVLTFSRESIATAWVSSGAFTSPWGLPSAEAQRRTAGPGGYMQPFPAGNVYSLDTGGVYLVPTAALGKYGALGGVASTVGWPAGQAQCAGTPSLCSQRFERGTFYWTDGVDPIVFSSNSIAGAWASSGGFSSSWGTPVADAERRNVGIGGYAQTFANGKAYSTDPGDVFFVPSGIASKYVSLGGVWSSLGWPAGSASCAFISGVCAQQFERGRVYAVTGGASVYIPEGPVLTGYAAAGGLLGAWGTPTSDPLPRTSSAGATGIVQQFTKGNVYLLKGASVAYRVSGALLSAYAQRGGAIGALGFPTSDMQCGSPVGQCRQSFQGGSVQVPVG